MTYQEVLDLIQQEIIANGNNEITADVLRPVLEEMLQQPNDLVGVLADLNTSDTTDIVSAINSILTQNLPNATALRPLDTSGVNFNQDELLWVRDAVNNTIASNGNITCNLGEQIVFYFDAIVGIYTATTSFEIQRRYYRLTTGENVVTGISTGVAPPLMQDGVENRVINLPSDIVIDLGDIGSDDIEDAFNGDSNQPFTIDGDMFIQAVQNSVNKLYQWIGGNGTFGNSATLAESSDFVDLTDTDVPITYGTFKSLTDTPNDYTGQGGKIVKVNVSEDALEFDDESESIPTGGNTGQVLTKQSSTDYDADWEDVPPTTLQESIVADDTATSEPKFVGGIKVGNNTTGIIRFDDAFQNLLVFGNGFSWVSTDDYSYNGVDNDDISFSKIMSNLVQFKKDWNASTNTPPLSNAITNKADIYRVSVAGSHDFGAGSIDFEVDDYVINDGTIWRKFINNSQSNSLPPRVGFSAKNSQTSMSASSFTNVVFLNEIEDTNSAWDGTTFTVPSGEGGIYEIFGHATFAGIDNGNVAIVGVRVNNLLQDGGLLGRGVGVNGSLGGYGGALRLNLSAGDDVNMVVYCENATDLFNSGGQLGYSTFSAYKMR